MEKTENVLDYTKVSALDYEDQIELLEEKLESGLMRTFNKRYLTVYYDNNIYYTDIPELECFDVTKSSDEDYEPICILAAGQVQSHDSAIGKRLEDMVFKLQLAQMSDW